MHFTLYEFVKSIVLFNDFAIKRMRDYLYRVVSVSADVDREYILAYSGLLHLDADWYALEVTKVYVSDDTITIYLDGDAINAQ